MSLCLTLSLARTTLYCASYKSQTQMGCQFVFAAEGEVWKGLVYTSAALDPSLSHIHAHTHVRKENNALADGMCHWNPCWYGPHTLNHIMALHGFKSIWRRSIQCGHTEKINPLHCVMLILFSVLQL